MATRKLIGAAAMTAALTAGGVVGATIGYPTISGAQDNPTTTAPADEGATPAPDASDAGKGRGFGHRGGPDLSVAAETLGITAEELRTELKDGKSMADVAEANGVDRQTLVDALVAAGEKRLDEAKANLPDVMGKIVDGTLPEGGRDGKGGGMGRGNGADGKGGGMGRGNGADGTVVAEALGITTDELRTAFKDGKSIKDIAEEQGVDIQTVTDAMVASAQAKLDEAVTAGRLTQDEADAKKAEVADKIAERIEQGRPDRPRFRDRGQDDGGN